ncbi:MAG: hypothetical protein WC670_06135 [Pseudolabrys sp.]|jgi:hypothetical protein
MSIFTKTILAAGLALTLAGAAHASDATELSIKANQGYFIDMQGHAMVGNLTTPGADVMARAQVVQPGTVFFMHDGKLMMVFDRSLVGIMSH